jgi:diguanylate cyclase (GGDEF)-like protein
MHKFNRFQIAAIGAICGIIFICITYALSLLGMAGWAISAAAAAAGCALLALISAKLYGLSIIDDGTGLFNRRYLFRRLAKEIARTKKIGNPFGIVVIDVDNFRQYNTQFGHLAGDTILSAIAGTLRSAVRNGDLVGRWGGEEFAIVLPGADKAEAFKVAERVRTMISELSVCIGGTHQVAVTISAGVASGPMDGMTLQDLLNNADQAMYLAKQQKNLVLSYSI